MKYDEKYADKMKYQIHGFQQRKLLDSGLSNDDALLLRVILDMYSSSSNEFIIENDDKYLWISYTYIQKVIPIIGSKSNIMSKIKKYEGLKLIERILKFERKGEKGSWAYIKPLKGLDELTEYENKQNEENNPIQNLDRGVQNLDRVIQYLYRGYPELRQGLSKICIGGIQNLDSKDLSSIYTSSNDLSNKDNSSIKEEKEEQEQEEQEENEEENGEEEKHKSSNDDQLINDFFESVWSKYPCKKGKQNVSKTQRKVLYKLKDELFRCIERYIKDPELKANKGFKPYQYGSTFFNKGYLDWLDKEFEQQKQDVNTVKKKYNFAN